AAVGQPHRDLHGGAVTLGGVHRHPVGAGVHRVVGVLAHDGVGAFRGVVPRLAHRLRHVLDRLAVDVDHPPVGLTVGHRHELAADLHRRRHVGHAVHAVTQVLAVDGRLDPDLGAR